jgi:hypothetical protein
VNKNMIQTRKLYPNFQLYDIHGRLRDLSILFKKNLLIMFVEPSHDWFKEQLIDLWKIYLDYKHDDFNILLWTESKIEDIVLNLSLDDVKLYQPILSNIMYINQSNQEFHTWWTNFVDAIIVQRQKGLDDFAKNPYKLWSKVFIHCSGEVALIFSYFDKYEAMRQSIDNEMWARSILTIPDKQKKDFVPKEFFESLWNIKEDEKAISADQHQPQKIKL